jgi:UDP-4-amino-4,6-dideoxy-N-acetyl-beta-L-altrosamine transaminase
MLLPYGRQQIDDDDIKAVTDALRGDFLTTGPKVAEFEKALAAFMGVKEAVVCSSGTAAPHLAMLALSVKPGDVVIVPTVTFVATANAARYCGAEVVFADVDPESGMMGVKEAEEAFKRSKGKAKFLCGVHLGGHVCDIEGLAKFAKVNGLKFMMDACHALGGEYKGKAIGTCEFEELSTFSFHPVKGIATGEGGAVTTNNSEYAKMMRVARSHGIERNEEVGPWYYEMQDLGFNYRLSDIQSALGMSQLKKLPAFVKRRAELAKIYDELLAPLNNVAKPVLQKDSNSAWHLYAVRIDFEAMGKARKDVMNALKAKDIGTQVHYIPVHTQPYYTKLCGELALPGADRYYARTLSLPLFPGMNDNDVERVVKNLKEVLA